MFLGLCLNVLLAAGTLPPTLLPMLPSPNIDGDPGDWADSGFTITVMGPVEAQTIARDDLEAQALLGGCDAGLLAAFTVRDDVLTTANEHGFKGDRVDLHLLSQTNPMDRIHLRITGMDTPDTLRARIDYPKPSRNAADDGVHVAARRLDSGYTIEVLLPWTDTLRPDGNTPLGVQCSVSDLDSDGPLQRVSWYPADDWAPEGVTAFPVAFAANKSTSPPAWTKIVYDEHGRAACQLITREHANATQLVLGTNFHLVQFDASNGWQEARFHLPLPGDDDEAMLIQGESRWTVPLPDVADYRARTLMVAALRFDPPVFSSATFPPVEFENVLLAERLLGPYEIETTFYDAAYNIVDQPETPGRYGAVVTVTAENGDTLTRFRTLFRAPRTTGDFAWNFVPQPPADGVIPPHLYANDPFAPQPDHPAVTPFIHEQLGRAIRSHHSSAALLAALYEDAQSGEIDDEHTARERDRQWWVGLKRQYYVSDREMDVPFVAPRRFVGDPAPTLRDGTESEAGMKAGISEALDAHLNAWAADSDEAFAVAVVAHGVLFYHKAFGERNGTPMTVDTPSWMASITKLISGTTLMTLVDAGRVDLDDPVDAYLPALKYIDVAQPLHVRDLYNHTNGLALNITYPEAYRDHWGDQLHDLEEIIAGYYPHLKVRERLGYNGVGYALGGKVMEMVSGESLPTFYHNHLFGPLGMTHTTVPDGSAHGFSTPRDMAAFGQMLLNKGSYGPWRFFRPETFEQMLPRPLRETAGLDTDRTWGVGAVWMGGHGLSERTFGHGAASAATLRIDPENELVIVMTRNAAGEHYGTYHPRFLEIIAEHLGR